MLQTVDRCRRCTFINMSGEFSLFYVPHFKTLKTFCLCVWGPASDHPTQLLIGSYPCCALCNQSGGALEEMILETHGGTAASKPQKKSFNLTSHLLTKQKVWHRFTSKYQISNKGLAQPIYQLTSSLHFLLQRKTLSNHYFVPSLFSWVETPPEFSTV